MALWLPQEANENSLWAATAVPAPACESLESDLQADVLVVGAGFTGLSSALHLAENGVSVVLLEAGSIGFGGSGRNAGLVNAGIWKSPEHVVEVLGAEAGQRFNQALMDSPRQVFDLVERHQMQCQARRCGTVHIAHSRAGMAYLQDRYQQLQNLGEPLELLDGAAAQTLSGSPAYRYGGLHHTAAGTIQPLSYARELARCAIEQGALLFHESALKTLTRVDDRWLATTACGRVSAERVILATNAYADAHSQGVREATVPVGIFQFATAPLAGALASSVIPQRHGLWDTHTLLTSSRIDDEGRLVMSFPGRLTGGQMAARAAWATRRRDFLYPQLREVPWSYHWTGRIGVTTNNLLRVLLLAPGLFAPAGFNGRGIGTGSVMGKYLAETITSGNRGDFPFPIEPRFREKWRRPRAAYYDFGTLALQLLGNRW